MTAFWTEADFDDHEFVHVVRDRASGLTAIIAVHSTHLGPGAGGTRFWHYPNPKDGLRDALRLSRGMSYKNAMAGLPAGGGKAVLVEVVVVDVLVIVKRKTSITRRQQDYSC